MIAETLQKRIARAMRSRREALSVSQEGFADDIGLHRTYYSSIERGERNVSLKNLDRIASGLGIPLSRLIQEAEGLVGKPVPVPSAPRRRGRPPGVRQGR